MGVPRSRYMRGSTFTIINVCVFSKPSTGRLIFPITTEYYLVLGYHKGERLKLSHIQQIPQLPCCLGANVL